MYIIIKNIHLSTIWKNNNNKLKINFLSNILVIIIYIIFKVILIQNYN